MYLNKVHQKNELIALPPSTPGLGPAPRSVPEASVLPGIVGPPVMPGTPGFK